MQWGREEVAAAVALVEAAAVLVAAVVVGLVEVEAATRLHRSAAVVARVVETSSDQLSDRAWDPGRVAGPVAAPQIVRTSAAAIDLTWVIDPAAVESVEAIGRTSIDLAVVASVEAIDQELATDRICRIAPALAAAELSGPTVRVVAVIDRICRIGLAQVAVESSGRIDQMAAAGTDRTGLTVPVAAVIDQTCQIVQAATDRIGGIAPALAAAELSGPTVQALATDRISATDPESGIVPASATGRTGAIGAASATTTTSTTSTSIATTLAWALIDAHGAAGTAVDIDHRIGACTRTGITVAGVGRILAARSPAA